MTSIDSVLASFSAAEQALRKIIEESESLSAAETRIDGAFTSLRSADKTLREASAALDSTAARTRAMAETLAATAEQFYNAAQALNEINPAEIAEVGQQTQAELHKLGTKLQQALAERTQETQTELHALSTRLEQTIADADSKPLIEAAKIMILQSQAEQSERVRAKVDEAVAVMESRTAQLESTARENVRRQNMTIACSAIAAVLALTTLVAVLLQ